MAAWSNILGGIARGARSSRAARFAGRVGARNAGPGIYQSSRGVRAITGLGNLAMKKRFMVPFALGAFGLGAVQGFGNEVQSDPMAKAWATGLMNTTLNPRMRAVPGETYPWGAQKYEPTFNESYPRNFGRPLGYYSRQGNYNTAYGPQWQPATNDPLMASGELMLATFATRHGR
jgi:hypothetical protein